MPLRERDFTDAVRTSVKRLFSTMVSVRVLPDLAPELPTPDILSTIEIQGQISGSISLQMTYHLAIEFAARLLQEPLAALNEEVFEAVAEITNMIAGGVKIALTQHQDFFNIGLPQVFDLAGVPPVVVPPSPAWLHFSVPVATELGAFSVHALLHGEHHP